jgi:mono/diheme cytochrome c family protein
MTKPPGTRFRIGNAGRSIRVLAAAALLGAAGLGLCGSATIQPAVAQHLADADDAALVADGKLIYRQRCASCHGRSLQGQPLWQLLDEFAGRRAPAQDDTGHSWQHSDEDIFHMTKYGRFAPAAPNQLSSMPGFADTLSDRDILAAIAFIKARWPLGLRVSQAMLNPGFAGMPARANEVEWKLPPNCNQSARLAARSAEQKR